MYGRRDVTALGKLGIAVAISSVGALIIGGAAFYLAAAPQQVSGKLNVVATFYPYYYFAARVGGSAVEVTTLLPPGVEPHDWDPLPSAVQRIYSADAFVYNGYLEVFLSSLFKELPKERPLRVNASEGITVATTANGKTDPHFWLDPIRAQQIAENIARAFSSLRPASAPVFEANLNAVKADLQNLHNEYSVRLATCDIRTIVTQHEAFGYLARRYNLIQVAIQGLSPDTVPTPDKMREIVAIVKATKVKFIFFEELVDPALAKTLAEEAKVGTMVLDPIESLTPARASAGKNYLNIMTPENLDALRIALQCK